MTKNAKNNRRTRIDAAATKTAILTAARRSIAPPTSMALDELELEMFEGVVGEFAKSELTDHTLTIAAFLARAMAGVTRQSNALNDEGMTITRPSGLIAKNPRLEILHGLHSQVLALRRSLAIHGSGLHGGDNRHARKRRAYAKGYEAEADLGSEPGDELINKPKIH